MSNLPAVGSEATLALRSAACAGMAIAGELCEMCIPRGVYEVDIPLPAACPSGWLQSLIDRFGPRGKGGLRIPIDPSLTGSGFPFVRDADDCNGKGSGSEEEELAASTCL